MYVCPPIHVLEDLPEGFALEMLLIELRQAFRAEAKIGTALVNPRRMALRLLADGFSAPTTRWLLREGRVSACVEAISDTQYRL